MAQQFERFEKDAKEAVEWLSREYSTLRTGRATPTLLDSVSVESYGARMSLKELGSVSVEDARTLRVAPWDPSQIKAIEKAIADADLGLSVVTDERGLRVIFPELTVERRAQLIKLAKSKLEDARVSIRKARDEAMKDLEAKQKSGSISEDDLFRQKAELQKKVDEMNKNLDEMSKKKDAEINS